MPETKCPIPPEDAAGMDTPDPALPPKPLAVVLCDLPLFEVEPEVAGESALVVCWGSGPSCDAPTSGEESSLLLW